MGKVQIRIDSLGKRVGGPQYSRTCPQQVNFWFQLLSARYDNRLNTMLIGDINPDHSLHVWDAAMRTSAAPTFFPAYKGYVDGGIVVRDLNTHEFSVLNEIYIRKFVEF